MGNFVRNTALGFGLVGAAFIGTEAVTDINLPGVPDIGEFLDGGEPDNQVHGSVHYQGEVALTAPEDFQIQIGTGIATVSIEAVRHWDTAGLTDFVPGDNGRLEIRDSEGGPAEIELETSYCADGDVELGKDAQGNVVSVNFDLRVMRVCDVDWMTSEQNAEAFHNDGDVPQDVVAQTTATIQELAVRTVEAAPCPDLSEYSSDPYLEYTQQQLADRYGVDVKRVHVSPGLPGRSNAETRDQLEHDLEEFTSVEDLDVLYTNNADPTSSCFEDRDDGPALDTLDSLVTSTTSE